MAGGTTTVGMAVLGPFVAAMEWTASLTRFDGFEGFEICWFGDVSDAGEDRWTPDLPLVCE